MELTGKRYTRPDWRKRLSTRRGTALIALACAVAAGLIIVFAMSRYRSSVDASGNPETVFVAAQAIPKNTPGAVIADNGMFKPTQIVAKQVSAGAIADASVLQGKVAVRDISPGEQLTATDFTDNGGIPAQLAPTQRAVTLSLDDEHGMLGLLNAGDHVDVYAGFAVQSGFGLTVPVLRLLIPNVPVLKAGTNSSSTGVGSGSNNTSQVTLKVPDAQAGALAYAADNGKVWLVLRPANATSTAPPSTITVQSALFGTKSVSGKGATGTGNGGKKR
jgi:Flp pilus assembly protein CpaB